MSLFITDTEVETTIPKYPTKRTITEVMNNMHLGKSANYNCGIQLLVVEKVFALLLFIFT